MAARVRKDDIVEVVAGAHRGARGKVLRVDPEGQRVVVEGVNMVYRHVRKSRQHPQGGRIRKEAAIHLSNVMPVDPKTGKRTRIHFELKLDAGGRTIAKRRVSQSGTVLSEVTHGKGNRTQKAEKR
jgi:large subunit ribosomal protein L24